MRVLQEVKPKMVYQRKSEYLTIAILLLHHLAALAFVFEVTWYLLLPADTSERIYELTLSRMMNVSNLPVLSYTVYSVSWSSGMTIIRIERRKTEKSTQFLIISV